MADDRMGVAATVRRCTGLLTAVDVTRVFCLDALERDARIGRVGADRCAREVVRLAGCALDCRGTTELGVGLCVGSAGAVVSGAVEVEATSSAAGMVSVGAKSESPLADITSRARVLSSARTSSARLVSPEHATMVKASVSVDVRRIGFIAGDPEWGRM